MAGGRPTTYTPELGQRICEVIATTRDGLKKLCDKHDYFPDYTTVALWRIRHQEFSHLYFEAKTAQMDIVMEELDEVLDENLIYYSDDKGCERIDSPSATIAIAKANNKKWYASKLAPKMYGDRKELEQVQSENADIKAELQALRAQLAEQNKRDY